MKKLLITILSVSLLALGCDPIEEETNNNNTSNNNNTNNTNNSTNNINNTNNSTNNTNNTDPGTCSVNDLPAQRECNPGFKCTITTQAGNVGCVDFGALEPGDNCAVISSGQTQDGCPPGYFCYPPTGIPEDGGTCIQYCASLFSPCPSGGICMLEWDLGLGSAYLCQEADDCDAYYDFGCGTNESCYMLFNAGSQTVCLETPTNGLLKGQPCARPDDCAPNHTCFGPYQQETCHALCRPEYQEQDCGIDECVLVDSVSGFGVCWNE
ncbi:hypothetical protein KKF34_14820 [Myxococcota bacterium]|nr:hypothetical protein [Myxococcota bacterium]MBU1382268.1 hypothetical protein [Myxococcota bacterium]MBU1498148.1 hypothetical protein [Myxococcota bacterium]